MQPLFVLLNASAWSQHSWCGHDEGLSRPVQAYQPEDPLEGPPQGLELERGECLAANISNVHIGPCRCF